MKNLKSNKTVLFTFFAATLLIACDNKAMSILPNFCRAPQTVEELIENTKRIRAVGKFLYDLYAPTAAPAIIATPATRTLFEIVKENPGYVACTAGALLGIGYQAYQSLPKSDTDQDQALNETVKQAILRSYTNIPNRFLLYGAANYGKLSAAHFIATQLIGTDNYKTYNRVSERALYGIFTSAIQEAQNGQSIVLAFTECEHLAEENADDAHQYIIVSPFCNHLIRLCENIPNLTIIFIANSIEKLDPAFVQRFNTMEIKA